MSEMGIMIGPGKNTVTALLALLKYVSDELGSIDQISQFCVDMAIHQLSDREHSVSIRVNGANEDDMLQ